MPGKKIYRGILTDHKGMVFLQEKSGRKIFSDTAVWSGYLKHWKSMELFGELLPEHDYLTGKRIALLWPVTPPVTEPFFELYFNERLPGYFYSYMGHTAINVNGETFNFSHLLNECEVMNEAEYFYRPALGKFSPAPGGGYSIENPDQPHLDKFGRQFMRSIHAVRITGCNTVNLAAALHSALEKIHRTPENPRKPGVYSDFRIFTNSCTTVLRDTLRSSGFPGISGVFPREMFTSAVWNFIKLHEKGMLQLSVYTRPQLLVDEAPASAMTPVVNPLNLIRTLMLRRRGIFTVW
ncbi:MAG TPA: hypothetical protein PK986_00745 [Spirochaetota bacterium]|nr:hypothetical protein [Spirochaetota bacterium]HQO38973.1 hypothetical protein [Spirochaetota bacterium]